jgi:hypothetical protein
MIDTVSLTQPVLPKFSKNDLLTLGAVRPKGQTRWVINPEGNEASPSITIQTHPDKVQYMTVRQSLPRLLHGHNASLQNSQEEINAELSLLGDIIYKRTGVVFDWKESYVTGVHFTRDIKVESEFINPILKKLQSVQLSRCSRVIFDHAVLYRQKEAEVQFYSKQHEVSSRIKNPNEPQAHQAKAMSLSKGVLRVEVKLARGALRRLIDTGVFESRRGKDVLKEEVSDYVVSKVLTEIQFDNLRNSIVPSKPAFETLIAFYSAREAMRLFGFLTLIDLYGKDFWRVTKLNFSRNTYYNNRRKCRDAGLLGA